MACVLWSRVYLLGFALHSVCAATATPDSHFHTLSMLANTRQHSLLCCSSRCMQHIAVSHVVCAHNCKSVEMDSENDWYTDTHTRLSAFFSRTTQVSRYQKGKTNVDFTEARDSEWQWHQLGYIQVCTLLQTTTPAPHHSVFLQAGCPSCRPTDSIKALKAKALKVWLIDTRVTLNTFREL